MKNDDLLELVKKLQDVDVQLPLHEEKLRRQLLEMRPPGARTHWLFANIEVRMSDLRASMHGKKLLSLGALIIVGMLVLGFLVFRPGSHGPAAKQLIAEATPGAAKRPASAVAAEQNGNYQGQSLNAQAKDGSSLNGTSAPTPEIRPASAAPIRPAVEVVESPQVSPSPSTTSVQVGVAVNVNGNTVVDVNVDLSKGNKKDKDKEDKESKEKLTKAEKAIVRALKKELKTADIDL